MLGQVNQRCRDTGNAGSQRAVDGRVALYLATGVAVKVAAGFARCGFAGVDKAVGLVGVAGLAQQEEAAAANA